MGSGASTQSAETEAKVYNSLRGALLKGSKKMSPVQELLQSSVYSAYGSQAQRMKSLYVVRSGGEMERFGLRPTFQPGTDKFIVRPLTKEFLETNDHFRKANDEITEGTIAIYSVITSILAITSLSLASHTQDYNDLIKEIGTNEPEKKEEKSIHYPTIVINALRTYSSQKYTNNTNPREQNIMFSLDQYSTIVPTMLKKIEDRLNKSNKNTSQYSSRDTLLHTGILKAIDSFSICSKEPKSLKNLLNRLQKGGGLDSIVSTMNNVLSKDVVRKWLDRHPGMKQTLSGIIAGTLRSAKIIGSDGSSIGDVVNHILSQMREQVVNACNTNEMLSTYSSKKNVLVKSSGSNQ